MYEVNKQSLTNVVKLMLKNMIKEEYEQKAFGKLVYVITNQDKQALIDFLTAHNVEADSAELWVRQCINEEIGQRNNPQANSGSETPSPLLYLIPLGLIALSLFLGLTGIASAFIAIPLAIFGFFLLFGIWSPKHKAKLSVRNDDALEVHDKLEKILEIEEQSNLSYAFKKRSSTMLVFILAAVICIGSIGYVYVTDKMHDANYHAAIVEDGDPRRLKSNSGTRYAVYDYDEARYVDEGHLPKDMLAQSGDDVKAIITIDLNTEKVGTYGSVGDAFQYYASIKLIDRATGNLIGTKTVYGSDPPKSIRTNSVTTLTGKDGYGSKPSTEKLRSAMLDLIDSYEAHY